MRLTAEFSIAKYEGGACSPATDPVALERLVEIYVNGAPYASMMATPTQLDFLAFGFLFSEGLIAGPSDIKSLAVSGLTVFAEIFAKAPRAPMRARSSGFGLGSLATGELSAIKPRQNPPPAIAARSITELMEKFNRMSELFRRTGAVHSAWLLKGEAAFFAEDVGRHNALDKVIGQYLKEGPAPSEAGGLLFTTGRVSAEMLLKGAKAGLDALISRGPASRLAVSMAEKADMILIGFARGGSFKAFCGGRYLADGHE